MQAARRVFNCMAFETVRQNGVFCAARAKTTKGNRPRDNEHLQRRSPKNARWMGWQNANVLTFTAAAAATRTISPMIFSFPFSPCFTFVYWISRASADVNTMVRPKIFGVDCVCLVKYEMCALCFTFFSFIVAFLTRVIAATTFINRSNYWMREATARGQCAFRKTVKT